jgi:hypothetical protein
MTAVQEVEAAKAMAPRGALLIGTAHGHSLSDILRNHVLNPLVGGVREVTLGDVEAKASNGGQKVSIHLMGYCTDHIGMLAFSYAWVSCCCLLLSVQVQQARPPSSVSLQQLA